MLCTNKPILILAYFESTNLFANTTGSERL